MICKKGRHTPEPIWDESISETRPILRRVKHGFPGPTAGSVRFELVHPFKQLIFNLLSYYQVRHILQIYQGRLASFRQVINNAVSFYRPDNPLYQPLGWYVLKIHSKYHLKCQQFFVS